METVGEIVKTDDPITTDLRGVADLHLAEIAEAWNGITSAEDVQDVVLFSSTMIMLRISHLCVYAGYAAS